MNAATFRESQAIVLEWANSVSDWVDITTQVMRGLVARGASIDELQDHFEDEWLKLERTFEVVRPHLKMILIARFRGKRVGRAVNKAIRRAFNSFGRMGLAKKAARASAAAGVDA